MCFPMPILLSRIKCGTSCGSKHLITFDFQSESLPEFLDLNNCMYELHKNEQYFFDPGTYHTCLIFTALFEPHDSCPDDTPQGEIRQSSIIVN
jgi:hypothetical protein